MLAFSVLVLLPMIVLPLGILCYFLFRRIREGRGFHGWKRLLAWSFILPGFPFFIVFISMFIKLFVYYDADKPILCAILFAPVTFSLAVLVSILYLFSVPKREKLTSGIVGLLVNLGCLALIVSLFLWGPPLA
jgi:hypothetical protein